MRLHAAAVMASKTFLRYPSGMTDMSLFYPYASRNGSKPPFDSQKDARLVWYADAGHLPNPHKAHFQIGYVFTIGNKAILLWSIFQPIATSPHSSRMFEVLVYINYPVYLVCSFQGESKSGGVSRSIQSIPKYTEYPEEYLLDHRVLFCPTTRVILSHWVLLPG